MALDRRTFLRSAAGLAGLASTASAAAQEPRMAAADWDLSWLDQLKGKHKNLYDVGNMDVSEDTPLRMPMNYLDAFRDLYHLSPPDVNVIVGIQRGGFPINASDALWDKYKIGERWGIKDPATGAIATHNIFLGAASGGPGSTVRPLQARGVIFWQCNIALQAVVGQLARATGKPPQEVRAEIVAGLNPGVKLVPAHTMLVGLAQERGFTYEKP
jgi:hypothetical protein